jgi:mRNA-degrading endonuclease RelE of RelBE toxin-antitoxin system
MKILTYIECQVGLIKEWNKVNEVILNHVSENVEMSKAWIANGYEGIIDHVKEHLGIKMYRNADTRITFEFTDEEWTMFLLRWS